MNEKPTAVPAPSLHSNGTAAADLFDQVREALDALRAAGLAMQAAAPHGRDYYVQGPDAYGVARDAHVSRLARLATIREELHAIAMAIADARDGREARRGRVAR